MGMPLVTLVSSHAFYCALGESFLTALLARDTRHVMGWAALALLYDAAGRSDDSRQTFAMAQHLWALSRQEASAKAGSRMTRRGM